MTLVGVIGNPRTGKTLLMTILIIKLIKKSLQMNQEINMFANYHFKSPYDLMVSYLSEPSELIDIRLEKLFSGIVVLDELWTWLESRGSGFATINKILSHVAFQSGKSGFDILWSAQISSSVDKRIRLLTDYFFVALTPTETAFRYAYVSSARVSRFRITKRQASMYYEFYDTRERILPLGVDNLLSQKKEQAKPESLQRIDPVAILEPERILPPEPEPEHGELERMPIEEINRIIEGNKYYKEWQERERKEDEIIAGKKTIQFDFKQVNKNDIPL